MKLLTQKQSISFIRYHKETRSIRNKISLDQHLFSFLMEGQKAVHYAGSSVHVLPEQLVLLSAGNCLMSEKTVSAKAGYESILVSFETNMLDEFLSNHSDPLTSGATSREVPFLFFDKDDFLLNYSNSLRILLDAAEPLSPLIQKVKLEELLTYLLEKYPGQLQKLRTIGQRGIDELLIRQAVTANINQAITVTELAFLCNTSLSTFKRRFADIYGMSPSKWLLNKRMEKAAILLKKPNTKVSDVYLEVGYENLSSFIKSFKQVYNTTPKQFQAEG